MKPITYFGFSTFAKYFYSVSQKSMEQEILESARREILSQGILGLRVADVAASANTSITQIYRLFRNRDGLLSRILGDIYDEQSEAAVKLFVGRLPENCELTIADLVAAVPIVLSDEQVGFHELRLQILATSVHNSELHDRLKLCTQNLYKIWKSALYEIQMRMAPGENFDERFFFMVFAQQNPYYRTLIGEEFFTPDEYRTFLCEKLRLNRVF
jgi:AcrR family transcriptional regulator